MADAARVQGCAETGFYANGSEAENPLFQTVGTTGDGGGIVEGVAFTMRRNRRGDSRIARGTFVNVPYENIFKP